MPPTDRDHGLSRRDMLAAAGSAIALGGFAPAEGGLTGDWIGLVDPSTLLRLNFDSPRRLRVWMNDDGEGPPYLAHVKARTPTDIDFDQGTLQIAFSGRMTAPDRIEGLLDRGKLGPLPIVLGPGLPPQQPDPDPLTDESLEASRAQARLVALAAVAERVGGPIRQWRSGRREALSGSPIGPDDAWRLASVTKSITATLVAVLAEAGKVSWNDQVGEVLGDVAPDMSAAYRTLTFRHLLSHRAGLRRDVSDVADRKAAVAAILSKAPIGPPETTFAYSNNGYILAGAMLEARLGQDFRALMQAHLIEPLGLRSAVFGRPGALLGHHRGRPMRGQSAGPSGAVYDPAGGVSMSLPDLSTYLRAHRDRASLLDARSWDLLHIPPFGGAYAMGWYVRTDGRLGHDGGLVGWRASVEIDRARGTVAAAVANSTPSVTVASIARRAAVSV